MGAMKRASPLLIAAVLAGCGTDVSGPSSSLLACVFGEAAAVDAGGVLQVRGEGNRSICIDGDGGSGFVYVPFFGTRAPDEDDPEVSISVELTGGGFEPPTLASTGVTGAVTLGPPGSSAASRVGWPGEEAFHRRLREREIAELEPRIRPGPAPAPTPRASVAAQVPTVGDLLDFNVAISCTDEDIRTGEVVYISDEAVVVVDLENPAALGAADYAYFAETFDTLVYPVETAHFGAPTDIDDNGRSILFFTRAVNELNPPNASSVTIGFFWSGDLFPEEDTPRLQACPAANQAEMFYLIAPDPRGIVGRTFTLDDVRELAIPLIGHEFQHLVNASRRLFVNEATTFERPWLNEGLSHVAEELLFWEVSGLEPGNNLGIDQLRNTEGAIEAFNEYMGGNFNNFAKFLSEPDTASLMGIDNLVTRGATWNFLRYAADRSGRGDEQFFFDVVNAANAGLDNLDDVIADGSALNWMHDWTVSVYGDDFVDGLPARYRAGSWNLRSVYDGSTLEEYPLAVGGLSSGATTTVDLLAGGAAYYRFDVAADGRAVIHVEADGGEPPPTLRGSLIRIR